MDDITIIPRKHIRQKNDSYIVALVATADFLTQT